MAEDNLTDKVRTSLIYSYAHFWMKSNPSAAPADLARFAAAPQRQQLFNVDIRGVGHFARRLDRLDSPTPLQRLQGVGERIAPCPAVEEAAAMRMKLLAGFRAS